MTTENQIEMFDVPSTVTGTDALTRLRKLTEEALALEDMKAGFEEQLSEVNKRLNAIKTAEMPDLMAECGQSEFKTDDGRWQIKVEGFVAGSLPKEPDRRDSALAWLEEHEASDIIKTFLKLQFEKSEHNEALSLAAELHERGYDATSESGVHPMTLISHIKERLEKGEEVPLDRLGLFAGRRVKIKELKGKNK